MVALVTSSAEQHQEILVAFGEIQATLDGISLDTQAIREHFLRRDPSEAHDIGVPEWVNKVGGAPPTLPGSLPPLRSNMGSAAVIVVFAALVAVITTLAILLCLVV
jgi:hypothetical protein